MTIDCEFTQFLLQGHAIIGRRRSLDGWGYGEDSTEPRGRSLQTGSDKAGKRSHVSTLGSTSLETTMKEMPQSREVNETICEFQRAREHRGGASR